MIPKAHVIALLIGSTFATVGCTDPTSATEPGRAVVRGLPSPNADLPQSSGFFLGGDGYYYWDGQPPPEDNAPATITNHEVYTTAPLLGNTKARASATMDFDGDQGKNHIDFQVVRASGTVLLDAGVDQEWGNNRSCVVYCRPGTRFLSTELETNAVCGVRTAVNGMHYARRAAPFGLSFSLYRLLEFSFPVTWGETNVPTTQRTDPGHECKAPVPRFTMSTPAQQSGSGGTLTITEGFSVSLQTSTVDFGLPQAPAASHTWTVDQFGIGTGTSQTITPGIGSHSVQLSLQNSEGTGEATASIVVRPLDEAGTCDDPLTDVVEECHPESPGATGFGIGGSYQEGSQVCWVTDYYWQYPDGSLQYRYSINHGCYAI